MPSLVTEGPPVMDKPLPFTATSPTVRPLPLTLVLPTAKPSPVNVLDPTLTPLLSTVVLPAFTEPVAPRSIWLFKLTSNVLTPLTSEGFTVMLLPPVTLTAFWLVSLITSLPLLLKLDKSLSAALLIFSLVAAVKSTTKF